MALEWCILDADGRPDVTVLMSLGGYVDLLSRARHLPLLRRLGDYWQDADYGPADVPALLNELTSLAPLSEEWAAAIAVCEEARRRGCGIAVLAD
jgi:hypothetical protein